MSETLSVSHSTEDEKIIDPSYCHHVYLINSVEYSYERNCYFYVYQCCECSHKMAMQKDTDL